MQATILLSNLIHSFIPQIVIDYLCCTRRSSGCWGYRNEQSRPNSLSLQSLKTSTEKKKMYEHLSQTEISVIAFYPFVLRHPPTPRPKEALTLGSPLDAFIFGSPFTTGLPPHK